MVDQRSRAFGYLVAFGSVGQTVAAIICPHLNWRWMFVTFGVMGFLWCGAWILSFKEIRITTPDDDYIIVPAKVSFFFNYKIIKTLKFNFWFLFLSLISRLNG